MIVEKRLGDANVLVGKLVGVYRLRLVVLAGFAQILAVERACQRHLALAAAALGADLAADSRTLAFGAAGVADFAEHDGVTEFNYRRCSMWSTTQHSQELLC